MVLMFQSDGRKQGCGEENKVEAERGSELKTEALPPTVTVASSCLLTTAIR